MRLPSQSKVSMPHEFIKLSCPKCDKRLKLLPQKKRKKVVCPQCGHVFRMNPQSDLAVAQQAIGNPFEELSPAEVEAMQLSQDVSSGGDVAEVSRDCDSSSEIIAGERSEKACLLYTSPSPRDRQKSRMPSSA